MSLTHELLDELAQVKGELASRLETTVRTCELLGIDLDEARKAPGKPSDVLFEHAQRLRRALNGSRKLLVESLRIERKLRHERDEADTRAAALQTEVQRLTFERQPLEGAYSAVLKQNDELQQRLAEAEKLPRAVTDVIEIAKKIEKQAFAKGVENFEIGTFSSLAYALKRLASPGCADEDPESSWENNFGPDYEVDDDGSILEADGILSVRAGYCQCSRLVDGSQVGTGCADGEKTE